MQKMYLLLRKNKQSGPFPLSELIKLDLKPMDLLWEEGKSKSWSYPTEIPELKDYVKGDKKVDEADAVYPRDKQELVLPKINTKQPAAKKPENIHVEVYVKLPERYTAGPIHDGQTKLDEKQILPENNQDVDAMNAPGYEVLNKKYVRDLDDIKEEYSRWIGKQKNNPLEPVKKKFLVRWAVLALVIAAGFIVERWNGKSADAEIDLKADSVQVESKPAKTIVTKPQKNKKTVALSSQDNGKQKKSVIISNVNAEEKEMKKKKEETVTAENESLSSQEKVVNAELLFKQVDIKYSYDTSQHEGLTGLHFVLHNSSEHTLNAVAVNVSYKNQESELLGRETIYVNNVLPGGSLRATASPHLKATSVTYKIGLISIEGKIYYSKAD